MAAASKDEPPARSRLLLLDGHSLAYRAFFALPVENFSTTTGQPTNAVYGFTAMLINVLRDEAPTHVAVTFDVSRVDLPHRDLRRLQGRPRRDARPTSRARSRWSARSSTRCASRSSRAEGFEADDVIATLATQARPTDMDVLDRHR